MNASAPASRPPVVSLSVASDVRRLIRQVEGGNAFDIDLTGHAYDVMEEAAAAIAARIGEGSLEADTRARIESFAQKSASTNLCCRLVVTDEMPDLPEYDPSAVVVYDGIQDAGSDFSQVIQRATIYGTLMTSVNITDLRAYFESGRKRRLLLFLGTDREADMKALDKMLAALPGILAAAGLDAGAIKDIIAAIKAGTLPAAAMKAVMNIVAIAQLKSMPATPQTERAIAALQKQLPALLARLQNTPGFAPALLAVITKLAAFSAAPAAASRVSFSLRADNDNARGSGAVQRLIDAVRPLARDKTLSLQARRDIAAVLRDLRRDIRAPQADAPRLPLAVTRMASVLAPLAAVPAPAISVIRTLPRVAAAIIPVLTPQATARAVSVLRASPDVASLPPRAQTLLKNIEAAPKTAAITALSIRNPDIIGILPARMIAPALSVITPSDIAAPKASVPAADVALKGVQPAPQKTPDAKAPERKAPDTIKADVKMPDVKAPDTKAPDAKTSDTQPSGETGPKYNPDGSLKDCCRDAFGKVNKPESITTKADVEAVFGRDLAANITTEQARAYLQNVQTATQTMNDTGLKARDTGDAALQADTARLVANLEGNSMNKPEGHICGEFCRHGNNLQDRYQQNRAQAAEKKIEKLSIRKDQPQNPARKRAFEP